MAALKFSVTKKNPKPNATTHEIETIAQIADILNEGNVESFLADFSEAMRMFVAAKTFAKELEGGGTIQMKKFTWIND